jgi:flagellar hook assembly protein FlgD
LHRPTHVRLTILNYLGQQVALLVNEFQHEGKYTTYWDAKNNEGRRLGSGVYLYRLETSHDAIAEGKLIFNKNSTFQN